MRGINKVILIGHLGADPEVVEFDGGDFITKARVATTETWKDSEGERQEKTEWHNLVFSGGLAEVAEDYLKVGDAVYIEGKIRTREYEDQDGDLRWFTEIRVTTMNMLGGPGGDNEQEKPKRGRSGGRGGNNRREKGSNSSGNRKGRRGSQKRRGGDSEEKTRSSEDRSRRRRSRKEIPPPAPALDDMDLADDDLPF